MRHQQSQVVNPKKGVEPHPAYPAYYYHHILQALLRDVEDEAERQDIIHRFGEALSQEVVIEEK